MKPTSQSLTLLTPCFCYRDTAPSAKPEARVPSLRGQLGYWARILFGPEGEFELLGRTFGKNLNEHRPPGAALRPATVQSLFRPRLRWPLPNDAEPAPLLPHASPNTGKYAPRNAIPRDTRLDLFAFPSARASEADSERITRLLRTWCLLGTLGRRGNRAAGSVWPHKWTPTIEEFGVAVNALALPPDKIRWVVLGDANLGAYNNRIADLPHVTDRLRAVASDTLRGTPPRNRNDGDLMHNWAGDPLGYVHGNRRKGSPLKLKVGHFKDAGYRLIAIFDLRHGDIAGLNHAVANMVASGKMLGSLLTGAF